MDVINSLQTESHAKHFLIAAVTQNQYGKVFDKRLVVPLNIQFVVNGVELSFVDCIENIYERFVKQCDDRIAATVEVFSNLEKERGYSLRQLKDMTLEEIANLMNSEEF